MTFKQSLRESRNFSIFSKIFAIYINFLLKNYKNQPFVEKICQILASNGVKIGYFYLSKLYFILGDFEKALQNINQLKAHENIDIIYFKAEILSALNRSNEAFNMLCPLIKTSHRIKTWIVLAKIIENNELLRQFLDTKNLICQNENFQKNRVKILQCFAMAARNLKRFEVEKEILKEIALEKTPQNHKKPKISQKNAKSALFDLKSVLDGKNLPFFLVSGTFLGLIREKNFIPFDYDLDIGIWANDADKIRLLEIFEKSKMFLILNKNCNFGLRIIHLNGVKIDVFLHYEKDDKIWHDGDFRRWWNSKFALKKYDFLGQNFLAPQNFELYLSENYGANWRTPQSNFSSVLDTPNAKITDRNGFIAYLFDRLSFDTKNRAKILALLIENGEEKFVREYEKKEI